jgi:hypothetical protein
MVEVGFSFGGDTMWCLFLVIMSGCSFAPDLFNTWRDSSKAVLREWQEKEPKHPPESNQDSFPKPPLQPPRKPRYIPTGKENPGEARALEEELQLSTNPDRIEEIIELLEKTRGTWYTSSLSKVIPKLEKRPTVQQAARTALVRRMSRFSLSTLKAYAQIENVELRYAAAKAVGMRNLKGFIPDLINLLRDKEAMVSNTAYLSLKQITGKDFGPNQEKWKQWWIAGLFSTLPRITMGR